MDTRSATASSAPSPATLSPSTPASKRHLLGEDKMANGLGVKGIGELGITSVAASIANAVFNATGKRMRDLPITPEKLIVAGVEEGV